MARSVFRFTFFVMTIVMALALGCLLQLRFYSMNELSLYLDELDGTVGDLQSQIVASLLTSSSFATAGVNSTSNQAEEQQQQQTLADQSTIRQTSGDTVRAVSAVEFTTGAAAAISTSPAQVVAKKDLRLDRFFAHVSNKTAVRNGVPVLRKSSRKCRAMNAYQRIEKQALLDKGGDDDSGLKNSSSSPLLAAAWQATSSVEFIGCCGLGHRLARMAAAAHLSIKLETALYGDWGCCDNTDVYEALFGHEPMILGNFTLRQAHHYPDTPLLASTTTTTTSNSNGANVIMNRPHHLQFTYEVPGFDKLGNKRRCPCRPEKIASDYKFFTALRNRYKKKQVVDDFVAQHFSNRTAIGMHIRAGNGEQGDFKYKRRAIRDEAQFVLDVVQLIQHLIRNVNKKKNKKPPILFLATDTEHYIETFRMALSSPNGTFWSNLTMQINNNTENNNATTITFPHFQPIPVVHLSQTRPPEGKGVLFGEFNRVASKGDTCMNGWHGALQDQMILSHADIVLAPKVSSFTQTLPLSLTVGRQHYGSSHDSNHLPKELVERPFCEGYSIATVKCYDSVGDWCCRTGGGKPTYFDINKEWYEWLL